MHERCNSSFYTYFQFRYVSSNFSEQVLHLADLVFISAVILGWWSLPWQIESIVSFSIIIFLDSLRKLLGFNLLRWVECNLTRWCSFICAHLMSWSRQPLLLLLSYLQGHITSALFNSLWWLLLSIWPLSLIRWSERLPSLLHAVVRLLLRCFVAFIWKLSWVRVLVFSPSLGSFQVCVFMSSIRGLIACKLWLKASL